MLVVLDPILSEGINSVLHILHIREVGVNVIHRRLDIQVLHFPLLSLVVDYQLGMHDLKCHQEEDQYTRYFSPKAIICVY